MKAKHRIRRRSVRKAPAVRRCGCNGKAGMEARRRLSETRESGLLIGGAKDPAESKAGRLAARAMAGATGAVAHRKCAACAAEDKAERMPAAGVTAPGTAAVPATRSVRSAVDSMGAGRALTGSERSFFEPRFGRDFSDVRVHEDAAADRAARGMDARAFAIGKNIGFARGELGRGGAGIMAHELAHTAEGTEATAQRLVRGNSTCPTTVPGTPADPMAAIRAADRTALELTLAASTLLTLAAQEPADGTFILNDVVLAYLVWFRAPPRAANGKFTARLGGGQFDSEELAI